MPKKQNEIKQTTLNRNIELRFESVNEDTRTVPAAISSEAVIKRWFGNEKLIHSEKSINMERAASGLPLLYNHDHSKPIGRADNVHLEDGVLRADLVFSENTLASEVYKDVQDRFLRDISIGYKINRYKDVKGGIEATRFTPLEVSVVTVPADHTVGINRNHETIEDNMENENENGNETIVQSVNATHGLGVQAGIKQEVERSNGIRNIFSRHEDNAQAQELMARCLTDSTITPEAASMSLLDILATSAVPTATASRSSQEQIAVVEDEGDKFSDAITNELNGRAGNTEDDKKINTGLKSYSMMEMVREFGRKRGISMSGTREEIFSSVMSRSVGGHSTDDFPAIMLNVANKSMQRGFALASSTWQQWAGTMSVNDFRDHNIIALSEFSNLETKPEGGEYRYGTLRDKYEKVNVNTLAKGFSLTREALINDTMGMLSEAPSLMGESAARSIDDLAYATLTSNPVLNEDGKTVFHADHNNIGSAGVPTNGLIAELMQLMRMQKGLLSNSNAKLKKKGGSYLNIRPVYIICPVALEMTIKTILAAEFATDDRSNPNLIRNALKVVSDPRLDGVSTTAYYVLGEKETVKLAFLNGNKTPMLASKNGWDVDGIDYHVRLDVGAAWTDFRAATYNAGA